MYFNEDSIDFKIINCIDKAKKSVQVCVFIYEWKPIADALISAKKRGVSVSVITDIRSISLKMKDRNQNYTASCCRYTSDNGIDVLLYDDSENGGIMHNKFVVIDDSILLNGSYNFQKEATLINRENLLLVTNMDILRYFSEEYKTIQTSSCTFKYKNSKMDFLGVLGLSWKKILLLLSFAANMFFIVCLFLKNKK